MASLKLLAVVVCLFACVCRGQRWDINPNNANMADRGNSTGFNPNGNRAGEYGHRDYVPFAAGSRGPGSYRSGADRPGSYRSGADRPESYRPGADRPGSYRPGADRPGSYRPGVEGHGDYEPNRFDQYGPQGFGPDARGPSSYQPGGYVPGRYGPGARGSGNYGPGHFDGPSMAAGPRKRYGSYQSQSAVWVNPEDMVASTATKTTDQGFSKRETIVFDRIITNINGGYNNVNGVFTAPVPGCYSISYNIQTKPGSRKPAHVALTSNGVVINSAKAKGDYSTSTNSAFLILNQYDRVSLQGRTGTAIGCAVDSSCTFNIALIKAGRFTDLRVPRAFHDGY